MLFNSLQFALFLPLVFALYWFWPRKTLFFQNLLLLVSSYFFYGCWDYRFLFLLIFSTLLDYYTGIKMHEAPHERGKKFWFWVSIIVNLGFLGVFKYFNFFAHSFAEAAAAVGWQVDVWVLNVILPVGISFYTFHGLSYVIDIYKGQIEPEKNFIDYAVFVSFFPLLVAGPIERATHLLPQIQRERKFDFARAGDGLRQILWGLFKKVVIADSCAEYANLIFNHHELYSGFTLVLGALFFTVQIYCDFSGYSDIALGTSRLFGIELLRNFAYPYFSRDIAEFWRRWHISLSTWFRDYLYIPLGGSKGGLTNQVKNTFIIFLVSGFWHGANWTFIVWGALNALYFLPVMLLNKNREHLEIVAMGKLVPKFSEFVAMLTTFSLTVFAWIFFRAENLGHAFSYLKKMFSGLLLKSEYVAAFNFIFWKVGFVLPVLVLLFFGIEWVGRERNFALKTTAINWPKPLRWTLFSMLLLTILYYAGNEQEFIYFQF